MNAKLYWAFGVPPALQAALEFGLISEDYMREMMRNPLLATMMMTLVDEDPKSCRYKGRRVLTLQPSRRKRRCVN